MKNIMKLSVAVLATVALLCSSCIKETFPEGGTVTGDQVAKSPFALQAMVNAIPVSMMKRNTAGYYTGYNAQFDFGIPAIHLMTDNMTEDIATQGAVPGYNWFNNWARNNAQGDVYIYCAYFWDCYYAWVKNCNDIISLIDPETATAETIDYLGQAVAYRAMYYLDMARLYEPKLNKYTDVTKVLGLTVPIVTEATTGEDGKYNPRAPREEMYEFILDDLAKAEQYLANVGDRYTSPTLGFVYGLYARAYLEMGAAGDAGAYQKAAEYARKAITTSGRTPLTQAEWEDPINGFNNGAASNSWILGTTLAAEQTGNLLNFLAHISSEATWGYANRNYSAIGANKRFYEAINNRDFRKYSWIDPQRDGFYKYKINGDRNEYYANVMDYQALKFRPVQGETSAYTIGACADHPLMRVEEMYFIEIEATAHINLSTAQGLLNDFMALRVLDGSYNCRLTTSTLDEFLTEMLFQKRVEFWGEGIVMFDHKRLDIGITRGYTGTNHAGVHCYNTEGRAPFWNIVITRGESQSNTAIDADTNNPDPSGTVQLWLQ